MSGDEVLELPAALAAEMRLLPQDRLLVRFASLPAAKAVSLLAASNGDWQLLSGRAAELERSVLSQLKVLAAGSRVPIWLTPDSCIWVRVLSVEADGGEAVQAAWLADGTELHIAPPEPSPPAASTNRPAGHSFFARVLCACERAPPLLVGLHPATMAARGLRRGDAVVISSREARRRTADWPGSSLHRRAESAPAFPPQHAFGFVEPLPSLPVPVPAVAASVCAASSPAHVALSSWVRRMVGVEPCELVRLRRLAQAATQSSGEARAVATRLETKVIAHKVGPRATFVRGGEFGAQADDEKERKEMAERERVGAQIQAWLCQLGGASTAGGADTQDARRQCTAEAIGECQPRGEGENGGQGGIGDVVSCIGEGKEVHPGWETVRAGVLAMGGVPFPRGGLVQAVKSIGAPMRPSACAGDEARASASSSAGEEWLLSSAAASAPSQPCDDRASPLLLPCTDRSGMRVTFGDGATASARRNAASFLVCLAPIEAANGSTERRAAPWRTLGGRNSELRSVVTYARAAVSRADCAPARLLHSGDADDRIVAPALPKRAPLAPMGLAIVGSAGAGTTALMHAAAEILALGAELEDVERGDPPPDEGIIGARYDGRTHDEAEPALKPSLPSLKQPRLAPVWCVSLPARALATVQPAQAINRVKEALSVSLTHAPALLIFEDLDSVAPAALSPEEPGATTVTESSSFPEALAELLASFGRDPRSSRVALMATCKADETLHGCLRSAGLFECNLKLATLDAAGRAAALRAMMRSRGLHAVHGAVQAAAAIAEGFSAAEISSLLTVAAVGAASRPVSEDGTTAERELHRGAGDNVNDRGRRKPVFHLTAGDFRRAAVHVCRASDRPSPLSLDAAGGGDGLASVGGLREAKRALYDAVLLPLAHPSLFGRAPLRLRSGALLHGPTGCGKTLLARAVAAEAGLPFICIQGAEILDKYIGASEAKVREAFSRASACAPSILFFDEFDAIGRARGADATGVTDRVVNQILCHLDGVEELGRVFVLAATNRPELIDAALVRPGRLDLSVACPLPDEEERADILKIMAKAARVGSRASNALGEIARKTSGFSGAELRAIFNNAQLALAHEALDASAATPAGKSSNNGAERAHVAPLSGLDDTTKFSAARLLEVTGQDAPWLDAPLVCSREFGDTTALERAHLGQASIVSNGKADARQSNERQTPEMEARHLHEALRGLLEMRAAVAANAPPSTMRMGSTGDSIVPRTIAIGKCRIVHA